MSTVLEQSQYGFDPNSRRTWQRRSLTDTQDQYYGYDSMGQVSAAARGSLNVNLTAISGRPASVQSWDYDPTGNWRGYHSAANGTPTLDQHRVHDRGNRLTQIEDNPNNMILDRVGRMRQMAPDASGDWDGNLEITWDAWSRITSVKNNGEVVGGYAYDGSHRRITREVDGETLHSYYNDAWRPVEERKDAETTASISYLWGSRHRDDLVRRDRAVGATTLNETRYVLMDYFNPAAITDETGEVKERYAFSAFGLRTIMNPDFTVRSSSECGMEFAFQGQFLDGESGLMNYGYRYYSPQLGRWTCKDPIQERGGLNLYAFAQNNGNNFVDYLGLYEKTVGKGGIITMKVEDCEIIILDGHGDSKVAHKFIFPSGQASCGAGGAYLGCYPGITNNIIPDNNRLNGAATDTEKRDDIFDVMARERRALFNGAVAKAAQICECCVKNGKKVVITVVDAAPALAWYDVLSTPPEDDVIFDFDCNTKQATRKSGGHKNYYDF